MANAYGNTIVTFKKDRIANRTTFTIGDSFTYFQRAGRLDKQSLPQPVTDVNPQFVSIMGGDGTNRELPDKIVETNVNEGLNPYKANDPNNSILNITSFSNEENSRYGTPQYVELQYHGKLTLDDVQDITVNAKLSKNLIELNNKQDSIEELLVDDEFYLPDKDGEQQPIYIGSAVYERNTYVQMAKRSKKHGFKMYITLDNDEFDLGKVMGPGNYNVIRRELNPDKILEVANQRKEMVEDILADSLLD